MSEQINFCFDLPKKNIFPVYPRIYAEFLSFKNSVLRQGRHRMHSYPAMLHPLLVDYLIENFASKDSVILDPFSGSGVTLLQASEHDIKSIGFDINPIALLISIAKTKNYDIVMLEQEIEKIKQNISENNKSDIPNIKNIDYWYSKSAQNNLGRIRYVLLNDEYKYRELFTVCFARVCREQSFTRAGEFKRYRIKPEKISEKNDKVIENYVKYLRESFKYIKDSCVSKENATHILDSSENIRQYNLDYDLIITSPPYGDSRTTVAYGEFSSFALDWINDLLRDMSINYNIDKMSVGKKQNINKKIYKSIILQHTLDKLLSKDVKRASDVENFFNEYFIILEKVLAGLKVNGLACFVVGNRRVKEINIPMDQITAEMMEICGMKVQEILVRDILNKVMPSKNSPTNKIGESENTMLSEYIIIARKGL